MKLTILGYRIAIAPPAKKRGPKGAWKVPCEYCKGKYKRRGLAIHKARCWARK